MSGLRRSGLRERRGGRRGDLLLSGGFLVAVFLFFLGGTTFTHFKASKSLSLGWPNSCQIACHFQLNNPMVEYQDSDSSAHPLDTCGSEHSPATRKHRREHDPHCPSHPSHIPQLSPEFVFGKLVHLKIGVPILCFSCFTHTKAYNKSFMQAVVFCADFSKRLPFEATCQPLCVDKQVIFQTIKSSLVCILKIKFPWYSYPLQFLGQTFTFFSAPCHCGSPGVSSTRHKVCIRPCHGLWIPTDSCMNSRFEPPGSFSCRDFLLERLQTPSNPTSGFGCQRYHWLQIRIDFRPG